MAVSFAAVIAEARPAQKQIVIKKEVKRKRTKRVVVVKPRRSTRVVTRTTVVRPGYVYIDGYWKWNNKRRTYVWVDGRYVKKKKNKVWVTGTWVKVSGGWTYKQGYWAVRV